MSRRYINADKLIEEIEEYKNYEFSGDDLIRIVSEESTVEVRENVSGEWIDKGKDMTIRWQCSNCRKESMHIHNFCPNCGADMT